MRTRLISLAAVAVAGIVGLSAAPAQASHSWNGYHWSRAGVVQLQLTDSVTSDWDGALTVANNDWNKSSVIENRVVAGSDDTRTRRRCPMISGAIRVCNYTYGNNGWAGLASINVSGKHITQGTSKMNDTYLATDTSSMRQLVMCQEIAHDFGLDHQDEDFNNPNLGTCMDYTSNEFGNEHPNQHDYDQLEAIYGHSDTAAATGTQGTVIRTGNTVTMVTWAK